ncbi:MAG TPA: hypothetical protein HA257_10225 [Candidatus Methanoperedenaceae archaeon]|nr:hypothetical protein [Candidatus Methanoperedenaceae archaeon]
MSVRKILVILWVLAAAFIGLFSNPISAEGSEDDGGQYIGPDGCKYCHLHYYDEWLLTTHSRAFERLVERKQETNASCLPCHTTGYNNDTHTYKYRDVTCEACHGSGDISNNIAKQVLTIVYSKSNRSDEELKSLLTELNLTKKSMVKNLTSEMCGRCHQGEHNPTYEEWNESKHSQSLVDLKKNKGAKDACLECHSTEYIIAEEHEKPTLKTVTTGLTCQACHDVHRAEVEKLLRVPKNVLCESCHNMEGAVPGATPHHPQSEMRLSHGGVDADTYIYQPAASCADCHRYTRDYNRTTHEPAVTGHSFEIDFNVCMTCHEGFSSAERAEEFVRVQQAEIMTRYNSTILKVALAYNISNATSGTDRAKYFHVYNESSFNILMVSADKSKGAHNPKYALELIDKSEFKADNIIKGQPEAKVSIPGFGILSGILMLALVWLVAARYRK